MLWNGITGSRNGEGYTREERDVGVISVGTKEQMGPRNCGGKMPTVESVWRRCAAWEPMNSGDKGTVVGMPPAEKSEKRRVWEGTGTGMLRGGTELRGCMRGNGNMGIGMGGTEREEARGKNRDVGDICEGT